jgi:hypothetical protein
VTHPFHPLAGQRVAILFERTDRRLSRGRVYCCEGGTLGGTVTLPESFTDRAAPAASGRLTLDVLRDLAAVVAGLRGAP